MLHRTVLDTPSASSKTKLQLIVVLDQEQE